MHLVQGQMKNQWQASTGHLNCSLEPTTRPALASLTSGPVLLNVVVGYPVDPPECCSLLLRVGNSASKRKVSRQTPCKKTSVSELYSEHLSGF